MRDYDSIFNLGLAAASFLFHQDGDRFSNQQDRKIGSSEHPSDSEVESHPLLEKFN